MALPVWQATIVTEQGYIIPSVVVTVLSESTGQPATLYSNRAGTAGLGSSGVFNAGTDGFAQFYAAPGEYRITAEDSASGFSRTWRYENLLIEGDLYNSTNLNPNVFRGLAGTIIAMGWAVSPSIAYFALPISMLSTPGSITQVGTFDIHRGDNTTVTSAITVNLNALSSFKTAIVFLSGLSGLTPNERLTLKCTSGSSILTVNK